MGHKFKMGTCINVAVKLFLDKFKMGTCINVDKATHKSQTTNDSIDNDIYYLKSLQLYQAKEFEEARSILNVLLKIKPNHYAAKQLLISIANHINDEQMLCDKANKSVQGVTNTLNHSVAKHIKCDITNCNQLEGLVVKLQKYVNTDKDNMNQDDEQDSLPVLNYFLHCINKHNDIEDLEYIINKIGKCNIFECKLLNRNNRDRLSNNDKKEENDDMNTAYIQIMDKMHCYYGHCYDPAVSDKRLINNFIDRNDVEIKHNDDDNDDDEQFKRYLIKNKIVRNDKMSNNKWERYRNRNKNGRMSVRNTNKRFSQLFDEKNENETRNGVYNFGYMFNYGYKGEDKMRVIYSDLVCIGPKYGSLKEELMQFISIKGFNVEYEKANIHFNTDFCRESLKPVELEYDDTLNNVEWIFSVNYLLAFMFYCNYDNIQYIFSKTYRELNGKQHNRFYYFGEYLKISCKRFGTTIKDGKIKKFYHGIGEKLSFPRISGDGWSDGITIYCPLSTSSSFFVASNFTNNLNGLVIEFCAADACSDYVKYFAVNWLSDFGNEQEYIFLQMGSDERLKISNIIDTQYDYEYKQILIALNKIRKIFTNNGGPLKYYKRDKNINDNLLQLMHQIISHQLSLKLSKHHQPFVGLDGYAANLINTYFKNRGKVWQNCYKFKKYHPSIFEIFFNDSCDSSWITIYNLLFPNMEEIGIDHINLTRDTLNNILYHLKTASNCKLRNIYIGCNINSELSVSFAPSMYKNKFNQINFRINHNEHDWLSIELNESKADRHPLRFLLDDAHIFTTKKKIKKKKRNKRKKKYKHSIEENNNNNNNNNNINDSDNTDSNDESESDSK